MLRESIWSRPGILRCEELRAVLEESAELEERVKTGRLTDTLAVELFLVKYSS